MLAGSKGRAAPRVIFAMKCDADGSGRGTVSGGVSGSVRRGVGLGEACVWLGCGALVLLKVELSEGFGDTDVFD